MAACRFGDDDGGEFAILAIQCIGCRQRVADAAEIAAGNQDQRNVQFGNPVEYGVCLIERHHHAADAFDQQVAFGFLDRRFAERQ